MTPRFTTVSAPVEGRVAEGILDAAKEMLAMTARFKENVNGTLHDETLPTKAAETLAKITVPSGAPFLLFCVLIAVFALRELIIRIDTKRILRSHDAAGMAAVRPPQDTHEHHD